MEEEGPTGKVRGRGVWKYSCPSSCGGSKGKCGVERGREEEQREEMSHTDTRKGLCLEKKELFMTILGRAGGEGKDTQTCRMR